MSVYVCSCVCMGSECTLVRICIFSLLKDVISQMNENVINHEE